MNTITIVAHRGSHSHFLENSKDAFLEAIRMGTDAIEFDVRLTKDKVPIIFHYFYLSNDTISDPVFKYNYKELKGKNFKTNEKSFSGETLITLEELLEVTKNKIQLELELKGPEPQAPRIVADLLNKYQTNWKNMEITSYEPALLLEMQKLLPDINTDLLIPKTESWMKLDVVTYNAIQKGHLSKAKNVHLHPTQLNSGIISEIHSSGLGIHAWDVNDKNSFKKLKEYGITRMCTDKLEEAIQWRKNS